jgi:hypothetical protein
MPLGSKRRRVSLAAPWILVSLAIVAVLGAAVVAALLPSTPSTRCPHGVVCDPGNPDLRIALRLLIALGGLCVAAALAFAASWVRAPRWPSKEGRIAIPH